MTQGALIKVGMADLQVTSGGGVLKTTGLGSCVGVTLYDPKTKTAGMAHIMLPDSSIAREGVLNKAKYADTAIPEMVEQMVRLGASVPRMVAKLAGGAQMFAFNAVHDSMRIGPRNAEACKEQLMRLAIPVVAEDTGGSVGRTIEFYADRGLLVVRTVQQGVKEL
jgi:chemotaxis protein CheD